MICILIKPQVSHNVDKLFFLHCFCVFIARSIENLGCRIFSTNIKFFPPILLSVLFETSSDQNNAGGKVFFFNMIDTWSVMPKWYKRKRKYNRRPVDDDDKDDDVVVVGNVVIVRCVNGSRNESEKEKCSDYEMFLLPLREFKRNEDNFVGMSDKSVCDFI